MPNNRDSTAASARAKVEPREFTLASDYIVLSRMLTLIGLGIVAVRLWNRSQDVEGFDFWRTPSEWVSLTLQVTFVVVAGLIGSYAVRRWRLRVDSEGLHRRRFARWQTWTWGDFLAGRIARDATLSGLFRNPAEPWWKNSINLRVLDGKDREDVLRVCLQFWTPPPLNLPPSLSIGVRKLWMDIRWYTRTTVSMGPSGIDIVGPGVARSYPWSDVQRLHIARIEERHPGFRFLRLTLPDRELELQVVRDNEVERRIWKGPKSHIVSAFLMQHVPKERTEEAVLAGQTASLVDIDARLDALRRVRASAVDRFLVSAPVLLGILAYYCVKLAISFTHRPQEDFFHRPGARELIAVLVYPLLIAPLMAVVLRRHKREKVRLEEERRKVGGEEQTRATTHCNH
jgi:hypothetical protein